MIARNGDKIGKLYGLSYYDHTADVGVFHIIPFNFVIGLFYRFYVFIRSNQTSWRLDRDDVLMRMSKSLYESELEKLRSQNRDLFNKALLVDQLNKENMDLRTILKINYVEQNKESKNG